ncbi:aminodeoxychorismate/anthranilate synthase component II [Aestuariibacter salexigens]|uniref:aminodeoxychorismate/anthranilate synthase component II n=1 Tax=Aestuariibacter salexigens TaxID=226010 RepID=UPI000418444C|nr:aminodeoxychorismate/anthranilate synthase component II [Aestuariibacter salexigens]
MKSSHVVLLDNVDSFTYNLVDELRSLGLTLTVFRNTVPEHVVMDYLGSVSDTSTPLVMLSPGPGAPQDAGCMPALLKAVQGKYPVLGICLGHQAIVEHYGGEVGRATSVMHGKSSLIEVQPHPIFAGLDNPLPVARYHSLMATILPSSLTQLAHVEDIPMAVYHQQDNMLGFQFHPESILTSKGSQLLAQSVDYLIHRETPA